MGSRRSISSKRGDDGSTGLLDGSRTLKNDLRPEAVGAVDEAAAFIGLARAKTTLEETRSLLLLVLNHLYLINAEIACPPERLNLLTRRLAAAHLQKLETRMQTIEERLQLPARFVLYGQCEISALLDAARTVVRRAERRLVDLHAAEPIANPHLLAYINRLSDALFLLARLEEAAAGVPLIHPCDEEPC